MQRERVRADDVVGFGLGGHGGQAGIFESEEVRGRETKRQDRSDIDHLPAKQVHQCSSAENLSDGDEGVHALCQGQQLGIASGMTLIVAIKYSSMTGTTFPNWRFSRSRRAMTGYRKLAPSLARVTPALSYACRKHQVCCDGGAAEDGGRLVGPDVGTLSSG